MGANDDFILDKTANIETATYFGLNEPVMIDSPHDVMLGKKWKNAACTIHHWIIRHMESNRI